MSKFKFSEFQEHEDEPEDDNYSEPHPLSNIRLALIDLCPTREGKDAITSLFNEHLSDWKFAASRADEFRKWAVILGTTGDSYAEKYLEPKLYQATDEKISVTKPMAVLDKMISLYPNITVSEHLGTYTFLSDDEVVAGTIPCEILTVAEKRAVIVAALSPVFPLKYKVLDAFNTYKQTLAKRGVKVPFGQAMLDAAKGITGPNIKLPIECLSKLSSKEKHALNKSLLGKTLEAVIPSTNGSEAEYLARYSLRLKGINTENPELFPSYVRKMACFSQIQQSEKPNFYMGRGADVLLKVKQNPNSRGLVDLSSLDDEALAATAGLTFYPTPYASEYTALVYHSDKVTHTMAMPRLLSYYSCILSERLRAPLVGEEIGIIDLDLPDMSPVLLYSQEASAVAECQCPVKTLTVYPTIETVACVCQKKKNHGKVAKANKEIVDDGENNYYCGIGKNFSKLGNYYGYYYNTDRELKWKKAEVIVTVPENTTFATKRNKKVPESWNDPEE